MHWANYGLKPNQFYCDLWSVYSQLSRKRTPSGIEKCTLVELSAYDNYSQKWTPKKNRVDVHLQES